MFTLRENVHSGLMGINVNFLKVRVLMSVAQLAEKLLRTPKVHRSVLMETLERKNGLKVDKNCQILKVCLFNQIP